MNRLSPLDWLLVLASIVFLIVVLFVLSVFIADFSRELKYLKSEISRTRGAEREYWKKRKRRLWLSLIPFVRY